MPKRYYIPVSGIYIIRNMRDNKVYIGQSKSIKQRWDKHKVLLKSNKHENSHLQNAWNKYGEKKFKFLILEYCPIDQLDEREQHYLDLYASNNLTYNIAIDAKSTGRGIPKSASHKEKLSNALKGRKVEHTAVLKTLETKRQKALEKPITKRCYNLHIVRALKSGKLQKPENDICVFCGENASEYHHPKGGDLAYVIPVCKICHLSIHDKHGKLYLQGYV